MEDDSYLPGNTLPVSDLTKNAKITSNGAYAEKLTNGHARPIGNEENCWIGRCGDYIEARFDTPRAVREVRLTLDSDLNRKTIGANGYVHRKGTVANVSRNMPLVHLPKTLVSDVRVDILTETGEWKSCSKITDNKRRVVYLPVNETTLAVRVIPEKSHGNDEIKIFTFDVR